MKTLILASGLLVAGAGLALAAAGGDGGGAAKAKASHCDGTASGDECPATALVAKWEKAAAQIAALPAEKQEIVAQAHETLSASCPVCKEAPASFAFLGRFLDSTVAFDRRILAAWKDDEGAGASDDTPKEIQDAFAERVAVGAKSSELYTAFSRAMAPPESSKAPEPTLAQTGEEFDALGSEASRLAKTWNGVPARAAALPAATKSELLAAMEVLKRELPTCDLAMETMSVLEGGLDRLVALDRTLAAYCETKSKEQTEEPSAEHARLKKAAQARARATADVARLLHAMKRSMTPEIFRTGSATASSATTGR